ncbi:MAG: hypothetical protein ACLGI6_07745 [Gammaproteobacteria bacterium]
MPFSHPFNHLGLPNAIARCAAGEIQSPLITFEAPAQWYGHPPALIPIWSDGSGPTYIGLWRHWFFDRKSTFVKMYVGSARTTVEVARTSEQLFSLIAMMSISERDGIVPELETFAAAVGIQNLAQIDLVSLNSGDDPRGFIQIDQFVSETPAESTVDPGEYDGDFPTTSFNKSKPWWENACSFEISPDLLVAWPPDVAKPGWLENSSMRMHELFDNYLNAGDLRNAWLTLNSSGWTIGEARTAISKLRPRSGDRQFGLLADSWLAVADESAGGY